MAINLQSAEQYSGKYGKLKRLQAKPQYNYTFPMDDKYYINDCCVCVHYQRCAQDECWLHVNKWCKIASNIHVAFHA